MERRVKRSRQACERMPPQSACVRVRVRVRVCVMRKNSLTPWKLALKAPEALSGLLLHASAFAGSTAVRAPARLADARDVLV